MFRLNTIGKIPKKNERKNPHKFSPRFLFLFISRIFFTLVTLWEKKEKPPTTTNAWNGLNFFSRLNRYAIKFDVQRGVWSECRQNPIWNAQKWCISIWQNENLFVFFLSSFGFFSTFPSGWESVWKTNGIRLLKSYGKINTCGIYMDFSVDKLCI